MGCKRPLAQFLVARPAIFTRGRISFIVHSVTKASMRHHRLLITKPSQPTRSVATVELLHFAIRRLCTSQATPRQKKGTDALPSWFRVLAVGIRPSNCPVRFVLQLSRPQSQDEVTACGGRQFFSPPPCLLQFQCEVTYVTELFRCFCKPTKTELESCGFRCKHHGSWSLSSLWLRAPRVESKFGVCCSRV